MVNRIRVSMISYKVKVGLAAVTLTISLIVIVTVTGQLADCQLANWTSCGLVNSQTRQLADATGDFACLVFVLLAASVRPRVVQLPS